MRVLVQLAQQREVFAIAVIVVGCDTRGIAVCDPSRLLLPLPPVGVAVVALDLAGRAWPCAPTRADAGPGSARKAHPASSARTQPHAARSPPRAQGAESASRR